MADYSFPNGYVQPPKPGVLPSVSFESGNATVFYNIGDEEKAQRYGDAFDFAYATVGKNLGVYPSKRFTLYIYVTQEDLVQGLQKFSNFSPQRAAFFETSAAPGPINYIMHVPPYFSWHDITHNYVHTILEEVSGDAFRSIKWLSEGLADYLAHITVLETKYKEDELRLGQSRIALAKKALEQGKLLSLASISTDSQWGANHENRELWKLQYAESYAVVNYLVHKYGLEKCVSILKLIKQGVTQKTAVQQALGIPLSQLEADFQNYLRQ